MGLMLNVVVSVSILMTWVTVCRAAVTQSNPDYTRRQSGLLFYCVTYRTVLDIMVMVDLIYGLERFGGKL